MTSRVEGGTDDRGATPVVATVLMVAVVIVVGAVIGGYVLDLSDEVDANPPEVSFTYEWENATRTLTVAHSAGDRLDADNTERLTVVIRDEDETGMNDYDVAGTDWANASNGGVPVTAGDTFTVTGESGGGDLDVERAGTDVANPGSEIHEPEVSDRVQRRWHSADGSESLVIGRYTIPAGEDP
jgi:flagellin-like protein